MSDAPRAAKASRYRYVIEILLFLTYVTFGIAWSSAGSFLGDIMSDLSIGLSRAGFINTSVSAAKIVGPLVAGWLSSRLGFRRAFLTASFLICLGILAPLSNGFLLMLAARFLMGLGGPITPNTPLDHIRALADTVHELAP